MHVLTDNVDEYIVPLWPMLECVRVVIRTHNRDAVVMKSCMDFLANMARPRHTRARLVDFIPAVKAVQRAFVGHEAISLFCHVFLGSMPPGTV